MDMNQIARLKDEVMAGVAGRATKDFPQQIYSSPKGPAVDVSPPNASKQAEDEFFAKFNPKSYPADIPPTSIPQDLIAPFAKGTDGWSNKAKSFLSAGLLRSVLFFNFPGTMAAITIAQRYGKAIAEAASKALVTPQGKATALGLTKLDWDVLDDSSTSLKGDIYHNVRVLDAVRSSPQVMSEALDEITSKVRISDPEAAEAATARAQAQLQYIFSKMPLSLSPYRYVVSQSSAAAVNELVTAWRNPLGVLENLSRASVAQVTTVAALWPEVMAQYTTELADKVAGHMAEGNDPPQHLARVMPGIVQGLTPMDLLSLQTVTTDASEPQSTPKDVRVTENKTTTQLLTEARADTPK
jgi:hypothetical protein